MYRPNNQHQPPQQPPAMPQPSILSARRAARNPEFEAKLAQMALPLAPLVRLTTGTTHPAFPRTLLHFWLLTDAELEGLASFYHQRSPCAWTSHYPCPIRWSSDLPLEEKRRKIGRFIGLRGCESPTVADRPMDLDGSNAQAEEVPVPQSVDEIVEDARRRAVLEDEGDEALRRKLRFYR